MKKLILLILICISGYAFGQKYSEPTLPAKAERRSRVDSTQLIPTGCGVPWALSALDLAQKRSAEYFDSCNHRRYIYDPKLNAWDTIHIGIGGSAVITTIAVADVAAIGSLVNTDVQLLLVKDAVTGGIFKIYSGSDAADNGMIFTDGVARKWIRQTSGENNTINVAWYGIRSTDADMRTPFLALLDYVKTHPTYRTIYFPYDSTVALGTNRYRFSDSILIDFPIKFTGDGTSKDPKTKIQFAAHKSGFVVKYPSGVNFFPVEFSGLSIAGDDDYPTLNQSKNAITSNAQIIVKECSFTYFDGCGIKISACAVLPSGDNDNYGNADLSIIENSSFTGVTYGVFLEGCDANVINIRNNDFHEIRRWGIYGNGQLGDLWSNNHFSFCGAGITGALTVVSYGGNLYAAKYGHDGLFQDAADSNYNKNPTNDTFWYKVPFMTSSAWSNTIRYYSGGPALVKNENSWTTILAPYTEAFQPPIWSGYRTKVDGGINGAGVYGTGAYWYMLYGEQHLNNADLVLDRDTNNVEGRHLAIDTTVDASAVLTLNQRNSVTAGLNTISHFSDGLFVYQKYTNSVTTGYAGLAGYGYQHGINGNLVTIHYQNSFEPGADSSIDLGISSNRWKRVYSTNFYGGGANLTGVPNFANSDLSATGDRSHNWNNHELFIDNVSQFSLEAGFLDLYTPSQVNEIHMTDDSFYIKKRMSYGSNIHGYFTQYSLIDKSFGDSAYLRRGVSNSSTSSLTTINGTTAVLKIAGSSYADNTLELSDPDGSTYFTNGRIKVLSVPFVMNANGSYITFQTGGVDRMRVKSTGEVGIGTTSPSSTLHVNGGFRYVDGNEATDKVLKSDASGNATWQAAPTIVASADLPSQTANVDVIDYTTDAVDATYTVSASATITAVAAGILTITCTVGKDWNGNGQTFTFYEMGTTTAGLSVTGTSNFAVLGEIKAQAATNIKVTATLTIGTATFDIGATLTKIR